MKKEWDPVGQESRPKDCGKVRWWEAEHGNGETSESSGAGHVFAGEVLQYGPVPVLGFPGHPPPLMYCMLHLMICEFT